MDTPILYRFFVAIRAEIDRHKWYESERAGHDVGYEFALIDWTLKHKAAWKIHYLALNYPTSSVTFKTLA